MVMIHTLGFPPQVFKAKPDEDFAEADSLQRTPAAQRWEESRLAAPGWQDAEELMAVGKPWENHGKMMESGDLYGKIQHFSWLPSGKR